MRQIGLFVLLLAGVLGYKLWTSPDWQTSIESAAVEFMRPVAIPFIHLLDTPAFINVLSLLLLVAGGQRRTRAERLRVQLTAQSGGEKKFHLKQSEEEVPFSNRKK